MRRISIGILGIALCVALGIRPAAGDEANDTRIKEQLLARLSGLVAIHPERLEVSVTNGAVRITGSVASVSEKMAVGRIAGSFAGASTVTNDLSVRKVNRPEAAIVQEVATMLENRPKFRDSQIKVTANGSEVTLAGKVKHRADRAEAEEIAGAANGVTRIINTLQVEDEETIPDEKIQSNVASALKNPVTFGVVKNLEIEVEQGRVTLRGTVVRDSDRRQAERLAQGIDGVVSVDNLIIVEGS